jgi:hypothetical protein
VAIGQLDGIHFREGPQTHVEHRAALIEQATCRKQTENRSVLHAHRRRSLETVVSLKKKRTSKPSARSFGLSRVEMEEQRINFAFGNAPEGSNRWVTRASLKKAATDRVLAVRRDGSANRDR